LDKDLNALMNPNFKGWFALMSQKLVKVAMDVIERQPPDTLKEEVGFYLTISNLSDKLDI